MIIAGDPAAAETQALLSAAQRSFCPNLVLIMEEDAAATRTTTTTDGSGDDGNDSKQRQQQQQEQDAERSVDEQEEVPLFRDVLEAYGGGYAPAGEGDGQAAAAAAAAYVCFNNACSRPVHTAEELKELL